MVAPVYLADFAGVPFPESKQEKGFKATGDATAITKGALCRFDDGTRLFVTSPAGALPGYFAVPIKPTTNEESELNLVVKGPVTVTTATILRRGMHVKPSATVAGQVDECAPDDAARIGKYMGTGLSNVRDGTGAPASVPAGTVVIIDLNYGVS